ncbi:SAV_915 family protein [Actinomadura scrupuli]|uniref:SAV_915 family protein n=1 Tax=Actinomadura scrupuli TaxID=559629 RepID=UPI003D993F32
MEDAEEPLFVPVRRSAAGTVTPLTARLPEGPRVGIAFTSREALQAAARPAQDWIRLAEDALRGLLVPLGIARIQVDPVLIVADLAQTARVRNVPRPAPVAAPAVTGLGRPSPAAVGAARATIGTSR